MFLPRSAGSQRNPRRRQRTSSDDSVKPPRAKRQRSTLGQKAPDSSSENLADRLRNDAPDHPTPITDETEDTFSEGPAAHNQLPIRSLKKAEKREDDIDGTVLLVCCSCSLLAGIGAQS